jgi:integrase
MPQPHNHATGVVREPGYRFKDGPHFPVVVCVNRPVHGRHERVERDHRNLQSLGLSAQQIDIAGQRHFEPDACPGAGLNCLQLHPVHQLQVGPSRGELLAQRWRDVDLDAGAASIRRSVGVIRVKGEGATVTEGPTKTGKPRVIDLDDDSVAVLRAWRRERGALALQLARDTALVFGDHEGRHRHPERFSRLFAETLGRARRDLGEDAVPVISLHGLRHTHATLMLSRGEDIKMVSARLGHAKPDITLRVYAHVLPGDQKAAAARFAALIREAKTP